MQKFYDFLFCGLVDLIFGFFLRFRERRFLFLSVEEEEINFGVDLE